MGLAQTVANQSKPITPRHLAWLRQSYPKYSAEALEFAQWTLSGQRPQRKAKLLNASGFGRCMRERVFDWLKVERERDFSVELKNTFETGNFMHLKWQMAGLTEGWLIQPEEDFTDYLHRYGARIDGVIFTGDLFEYKSCKEYDYKRVVKENRPMYDHMGQTHYAMMLSGITEASIVYENKADGSWTEFPVKQSDHFTVAVEDELDEFTNSREANELPAMRPQCADPEQRDGTYERCAFRDICPVAQITDEQWAKAKEVKA
jgi:hypothetical protein